MSKSYVTELPYIYFHKKLQGITGPKSPKIVCQISQFISFPGPIGEVTKHKHHSSKLLELHSRLKAKAASSDGAQIISKAKSPDMVGIKSRLSESSTFMKEIQSKRASSLPPVTEGESFISSDDMNQSAFTYYSDTDQSKIRTGVSNVHTSQSATSYSESESALRYYSDSDQSKIRTRVPQMCASQSATPFHSDTDQSAGRALFSKIMNSQSSHRISVSDEDCYQPKFGKIARSPRKSGSPRKVTPAKTGAGFSQQTLVSSSPESVQGKTPSPMTKFSMLNRLMKAVSPSGSPTVSDSEMFKSSPPSATTAKHPMHTDTSSSETTDKVPGVGSGLQETRTRIGSVGRGMALMQAISKKYGATSSESENEKAVGQLAATKLSPG